jgi:hypothetical protein
MFLLVATALAGTNIGFPCQRLNWGWRNVWSTCSINSFAPASAADTPANTPNGFRFTNVANQHLLATGVFAPSSTAATPLVLCTQAALTGTGISAGLRNRCRRAIDAYGALVVGCAAPAGTAIRGPNMLLTPDYAPQAGHQPHVSNVQGLTQNAQMCLLPPAIAGTTPALATPSTTCPGLLGWFTVVYSACKFTQAPGLNNAPSVPYGLPNYFPIGSTVNTAVAGLNLAAAAVTPTNRAGYFCGANGGVGVPEKWNDSTPSATTNTFRSSRCRKALDQFGRTANRCAASTATTTGPAQAGGYSDPLRLLAVGSGGATQAPNGINSWAPACN